MLIVVKLRVIYRSSIEHSGDHNPLPEAAGVEMPGRFDLGVARTDGTLDDVLRKIAAASHETKRREEIYRFEREPCCDCRWYMVKYVHINEILLFKR